MDNEFEAIKKTGKYVIDLQEPDDSSIQIFEKADKNILQARIQLPTGQWISNPAYRVELVLGRDAMIGLGTELIRAAFKNSDFYTQMSPSRPDFAVLDTGVYLHPDSCEVLLNEGDFETLKEILSKSQGA